MALNLYMHLFREIIFMADFKLKGILLSDLEFIVCNVCNINSLLLESVSDLNEMWNMD
jgi:hypothetical protein